MNKELLFYKDYTLPSHGKIYSLEINPNITLRGMNKNELNKFIYLNEKSYLELSKILNECLENTLSIDSLDLCLIDFEFLLFKVRTLSFGYDYKEESVCPNCHSINAYKINISGLDLIEYNEKEFDLLTNITLNKSTHTLKLKLLSIRELLSFDNSNYQELVYHSIDSIDNKKANNDEIKEFVDSLNLLDKRILNNSINKLNSYLGIKKNYSINCGKCQKEYKGFFSYKKEFFNPKIEN